MKKINWMSIYVLIIVFGVVGMQACTNYEKQTKATLDAARDVSNAIVDEYQAGHIPAATWTSIQPDLSKFHDGIHAGYTALQAYHDESSAGNKHNLDDIIAEVLRLEAALKPLIGGAH